MNKIQQIASNVNDKHAHDRQYPVGKAQGVILNALGITNVNGHSHAQQIFDALGLDVSSKRVGRKSVPVVTIQKEYYGSPYSEMPDEAGVFSKADGLDFSAISEYME